MRAVVSGLLAVMMSIGIPIPARAGEVAVVLPVPSLDNPKAPGATQVAVLGPIARTPIRQSLRPVWAWGARGTATVPMTRPPMKMRRSTTQSPGLPAGGAPPGW